MPIHTIFDIMVVIALTIFAAYGAKRGMIDEVLGLTGWIVAVLVALHFMNFVAAKLNIFAKDRLPMGVLVIMGFFIILIAVRLMFQAVLGSFQKIFSPDIVSKVNKMGGAFFGFFKGMLFISVLTLALSLASLGHTMYKIQTNSLLFRHLTRLAPAVLGMVKNFVPQSDRVIDKFMDSLENAAGGGQSYSKLKYNSTTTQKQAIDTSAATNSNITPPSE